MGETEEILLYFKGKPVGTFASRDPMAEALNYNQKRIDNFTLGEGVMPASFNVLLNSHKKKETLIADFGGNAIGRVAPVDSGFWWIILLRSYTNYTHDYTLAERSEVRRGMKLILNLCLSNVFDIFPTLLCADGCSVID
ncbi:hypothetical protein Patl1_23190 [Pistacia atlantica]|uniref:Uncharacterized protein n=1 Tax=Pistacia atlantica TaxID=434234 RepID=A0ACC0ZXF3_9ROSI|nr:hypothetical protein Patl1_23190 [Pistacia atlantica]